LPANTKNDAVYLVAGVIPIFDELCKRVLNFVLSCYHSDSDLVRFVVKCGILSQMWALQYMAQTCVHLSPKSIMLGGPRPAR